MEIRQLIKMKEFYMFMYIVCINIYGFILMGLDKYKARKEKWRIKERTFFIIALLGGAMGAVLGMTMFRHKTQHASFYLGIPIIYIVNILCSLIIIYYSYSK